MALELHTYADKITTHFLIESKINETQRLGKCIEIKGRNPRNIGGPLSLFNFFPLFLQGGRDGVVSKKFVQAYIQEDVLDCF